MAGLIVHAMPDCVPFPKERLVIGRFLGDNVAGRKGAAYEIWTTSIKNRSALDGIRKSQREFAAHHVTACPEIKQNHEEWLQTLSCSSNNANLQGYMSQGIVVLRAVVLHPAKDCEVIGYISGDAKKSHLHVNHIVVSRQHRGCGVGRLLFDAFLKHFGSSRDINLEVYLGNKAAFARYLRWGFQACESTKRVTHMKWLSKLQLENGNHGHTSQNGKQGDVSDEVGRSLRRVQRLSLAINSLFCSLRSLIKQLTYFSADPQSTISDRFLGRWTVTFVSSQGSVCVWGKAVVGPLSVGSLEPLDAELDIGELHIHGLGTAKRPYKLNEDHATLLAHNDRTITWALPDGGGTTWTLDDGTSDGPPTEFTITVPTSHHPCFDIAIQHHVERLSAVHSELLAIKNAKMSPLAKHHLKPRTHLLGNILDDIEKKLTSLGRRFQRKRKAPALA